MHQDSKSLKENFTNYPDNLIKCHRITFTDKIIDNICAKMKDDESFTIAIFTIDGVITQMDFRDLVDPTAEPRYNSTHFIRNFNIVCVEYLYSSDTENSYFALGSINGTVYIGLLGETKMSGLNFDIIAEVKTKTLTEKISSFIPLSLLKQESNEIILNIKYIGNNLIAYVTSYFQFKLWNIKERREIYSECLIKNRTSQILNYSRIEYLTINLEEGLEPRSKSFLFTLYLEYDVIYCINTFEMLFTNIPRSNITNSAFISNFNTFFNTIELGSNVIKKNSNIHKLEGKLIDIKAYDDKVWIISERYEKIERLMRDGDYMFISYDIKIFNRSNTTDTNIVLMNERIKNYYNILLQVSIGKPSRESYNEILKCLFNNYDLYLSELDKDGNYVDKIKHSIITQLENRAVACDFFLTEDINSLCVLRYNSLSFIKYVSEFDKINVLISNHEYYLRKMLFEDNNYSLSEKSSGAYDIGTMITHYIGFEKNRSNDNLFYIILAMLRIYMTEVNILMDDVVYANAYFSSKWKDYNSFIKEYFNEPLNGQFGNLNHLDVFYQMIHEIYLNNQRYIDDQINVLKELFWNYFTERNNEENLLLVKEMYVESNEFVNPKLCEILPKLILEKITSIYHLSRDLLTFTLWQEQNIDFVASESKDVQTYFKDYYSLYLISTSKIGGGFVLETIINENLNYFSGNILADTKNKYVDYIIFKMTKDFIYESNWQVTLSKDYYTMVNKLINYEKYETLATVIKIQGDAEKYHKRLEQVFLKIISLIRIKNNKDWIDLLDTYFTILIDIENNQGEFTHFEDFYSIYTGNRKLISGSESGYIIIKGYHYLNNEISKHMMDCNTKFEFYNNCYTRIFLTLNENDSKDKMAIVNDYLSNLIRYAITIDFDIAYNYYLNTRDKLNIDDPNHYIVEQFTIYLLNNYTPTILKIITKDNHLCDLICQHLEQKAKLLFNNIGNIMNLIEVNFNKQGLITDYDGNKVYKLLLNIYTLRCENSRAARIYHTLYECVNSTLSQNNEWKSEDLFKAYKFKLKIMEDLVYFTKLSLEEFNDISSASYRDLTCEKELVIARIELLKYVIAEGRLLNGKIFHDEEFLSEVFRFKLYHVITDYNVIAYLESNKLKHLLINNFISVNLSSNENLSDGISRLDLDKEAEYGIQYGIYSQKSYLSIFYSQIAETNDIDLIRIGIETLLSLYNHADIPEKLVKVNNIREVVYLRNIHMTFCISLYFMSEKKGTQWI
jgi:hypothetical protein